MATQKHFISRSSKYPYRIHVELPDGSVKAFVYSGPENTWVMAGEKMRLAKEYGVNPNNVIVLHREHGAVL